MIPVDLPPEVAAVLALAVLAAAILADIRRVIARDRIWLSAHHEDTVEIVPTGWMPPIGARRLALHVDTQQMEPVRDEVTQ